jgi:N-acetylmuramoyl-L-alanine amidase
VPTRTWTIRHLGEDFVLEVWPEHAGDPASSRDGADLAALLVRGIHAGDPAARRVLFEIFAALQWSWPERIEPATVRDALESAAQAGYLRLRRRSVRTVIQRFEDATEEPVLGPPPEDDAPVDLVWIGITLVNQDGEPVPNRPYRVIAPDGQTYAGNLDSHGAAFVRGIPSGSCKVFCPDYAPHGPVTHVVQPGEHISGIALQHGFEDYTDVWKYPDNADLAGKRDVAHVLDDGDEVHVPELQPKGVDKPTGAKHEFTIKQSPLKLRVKLLGSDMKPVSNAACTLDGTSLTSDGDGVVEIPVDKLTDSSTLSVDGSDLAMSIGRLDPLDDATESGWKARLFNLGFLVDPTVPDDDEEVTFALRDFQAEHSLDLSGAFDDATKSKLKEVYGC